MKNSIQYIITLLLLFCNIFVYSQNKEKEEEDIATILERKKYEDIDYKKYYLELKPHYNTEISDAQLQELKKIIKYQPLEVNPLFQVSEYYYQRINSFDVLRQYQAIQSTCDSASRYIELFEKSLTEKEIKKKWKRYYLEFLQFPANQGKGLEKVTQIEIQSELARRKEVLAKQKSEVDSIYINFKECINEYLIANEQFREVCGKYPTIKDFYILAEHDNIFAEIQPIKDHYQKALDAFQRYKQALEVHPIEGYTTEIIEVGIDNYRIHGLTTTSFLNEDIRLWNYAKWYDDVSQFYQAEILPMRNLVTAYDHYLNDVIIQKEKSKIPSEDRFYLDVRKIGKIKKYDPNAYPVNIFEYKEQKINLLNQITYSNVLNTGRKADLKYIRSQADIWTECNKAIHRLRKISTDQNSMGYKKHATFFAQEYQDDLSNYVNNEKSRIKLTQQKSEDLLKTIIENYFSSTPSDSAQFVSYQKDSISLESIQETNDFIVRRMKTIHTRPNKDDHTLVIGTIRDKKSLAVFIADIDTLNEVNWLSKYEFDKKAYQDAPNIDIPSINVKGGVVHLMLTAEGIKVGDNEISLDNKVVIFDAKTGDQLNEIPVSSQRYPRVFEYLQETKSYLIAYKGKTKNSIQEYDTLNIQNIKIDGEQLWSSNYLMQGMITEILPLQNQFLLVANINKLSDINETNILLANNMEFGKFNTAILKIDSFGQAKDGTVLKSEQPYESIFALSDYDNTLNLIGVKGDYSRDKNYTNKDLMLVSMRINNLKVEEKNIQ
ncbi:hypothetical protein MY04_4712 [Flammeovirga sp. MY04]|uniref:hypothetical protein n=1 Tax=Flammeovirga sp. MY04 TaxID=1191459 RepID=UPI0008063C24|nr:hypothetical protein [Flammeovirga sp. MY04]ANQ52047.1 hypothetical protein MY04_4712 [Flammeovirga sp. MY04]